MFICESVWTLNVTQTPVHTRVALQRRPYMRIYVILFYDVFESFIRKHISLLCGIQKLNHTFIRSADWSDSHFVIAGALHLIYAQDYYNSEKRKGPVSFLHCLETTNIVCFKDNYSSTTCSLYLYGALRSLCGRTEMGHKSSALFNFEPFNNYICNGGLLLETEHNIKM